MTLTLSARCEALIRDQFATARYDSPGQLVEEALLLLEERDHVRALRGERLKRELADGVFQANNRQLVGSAEVFAGLTNQARNAIE